jgi:hypothetical protein
MYFIHGSEWSTEELELLQSRQLQLQITLKKQTTEQAAIIDNTSGSNTGDKTLAELEGVASNELISAATGTKITYDAGAWLQQGSCFTTDDIANKFR